MTLTIKMCSGVNRYANMSLRLIICLVVFFKYVSLVSFVSKKLLNFEYVETLVGLLVEWSCRTRIKKGKKKFDQPTVILYNVVLRQASVDPSEQYGILMHELAQSLLCCAGIHLHSIRILVHVLKHKETN